MGIVTAPFKFIGGLAGASSDQDLGYVAFDPGKNRLDQAQKDKLDLLITVLGKKTNLKLEIMSQYNMGPEDKRWAQKACPPYRVKGDGRW